MQQQLPVTRHSSLVPKHRIAILLKGRLIAAIALDTGAPATDGSTVHAVGSVDPRCSPARHLRAFETPDEAAANFLVALAVSRDRGWTVAHLGERNFG